MTTYTGRDGRTFEISCPNGAPQVGTWHELNGYRFRETLHGPMRWGVCVDCGKRALEIQPTGIATDVVVTEARCESCGRDHHGATLAYYETGRDDLYRKVSPFAPHRRDPKYGGQVALADFIAQINDRWLPPHERPARCRLCAGVIDPAERTVEHPDLHPTCVRGWELLPASAPMETPLPREGR